MKLFEIFPTGDPYNKTGWDIREYDKSFDETICIFRGDLSPSQGCDRTVRMLRNMYRGCKIRVSESA